MTFDLKNIFQGKNELRRQLAALPIAEKLAMLDGLRSRTLALAKNRAKHATDRNASGSGSSRRPTSSP